MSAKRRQKIQRRDEGWTGYRAAHTQTAQSKRKAHIGGTVKSALRRGVFRRTKSLTQYGRAAHREMMGPLTAGLFSKPL